MKWFRQHIRTGSRLALFALAVQFVLSFGHFHPLAAVQAAQSVASQSAGQPSPSHQDDDRQPVDTCAICAVMSLAGHVLLAAPPMLVAPEAIALPRRSLQSAYVRVTSARAAFQSRGPPLS